MIIIEDKIVGADVVEKQFICNLNACKGACCWEGDFGAPVTEEETAKLEAIFPDLKPFLLPEGIAMIEKKGVAVFYKEPEEFGTPLLPSGACAFMTKDELGISHCGIEQAYNKGITDFKKPISCHLYPIRVEKGAVYETLNYDKWDICSAACTLGEEHQVPIYQFVKEAIIRKYGQDFYDQLDAAAKEYKHWSVID